MDLLPEPRPQQSARRRTPLAWFRKHDLGRGFWTFFTAAFFFDAGFSVYFFLFNLYLLDFRFSDRLIGLIGGAFALGSVAGTLPAGALARKIGVRRLLIACFIAAPLFGALRAVWLWPPAQIGLAFLAGVSMCGWSVGYLPSIAGLTTEKNRPGAFSLIYSASIASSAVGAVVSGRLPLWLSRAGWALTAVEVKRLTLLGACAIAAAGMDAVLLLPRTSSHGGDSDAELQAPMRWSRFRLDPFLVRFLVVMGLWSAVLASFTPFANVYLSRQLHIPLAAIGIIFAAAQVVQLCAGLLNPALFRFVGLAGGIVVTNFAAAVALALLSFARSESFAVPLYLIFAAAQWMSCPGLYNLLMNETPEQERSTAAALTMFCSSVVGCVATPCAGTLFTRFGYPHVLLGIAAFALCVAILCRVLLPARRSACAAKDPASTSPRRIANNAA